MNKLGAFIMSMFLLSLAAQADHHVGGKHAGKHKDRLISNLDLTEDQRQPVTDILKEQWKKRKEIMQPALDQVQPEMETLREETRQRLAAVLTEEQLQKYDELSSKRQERMQKRFRRQQ